MPRDHQPVRREGRRRALEHGGRLDPWRCSISDGGVSGSCDAGQQIAVALRASTSSDETLTTPISGRPVSRRPRPFASAGRQHVEHRLADCRGSTAPADPPLQEKPCSDAPRAGLEQHGEIAAAGQERVEPDAEQRVAGIGLAADRPGRARLDREPAAMRIDLDVGRQVELGPVVAGGIASQTLTSKKPIAVVEPDRLRSPRVRSTAAPADMLSRGTSKSDRRLGGVGAAPPQPHRAGIAGRRDVAAPGAAQQQRVGVEPARAALGFRQDEAVAHEGLARKIELAQHHRIAAAARQAQDGAVVACRAVSRRRSRSSLRPPPPQAHRGRAGLPRRAARAGNSPAWCAATGRADAGHPSRNCRNTARAARCRESCRADRESPPGRRDRRQTHPCRRPKASARSVPRPRRAPSAPSMSSSQRYGSSSGAAIVGLVSSGTGMNSTGRRRSFHPAVLPTNSPLPSAALPHRLADEGDLAQPRLGGVGQHLARHSGRPRPGRRAGRPRAAAAWRPPRRTWRPRPRG